MGKLQYLVVHCSDTAASREVTKGDIERWHLGPLTKEDGKVIYRGKEYSSWKELPKESIDGVPLNRLSGRGWSQVGYSDLIQRSGELVNLVPYNLDDYVSTDERTWGVIGINNYARHICLAGGRTDEFRPLTGKIWVVFTPDQVQTLIAVILAFVKAHPAGKVGGHYQWAKKSCPNFDVAQFCVSIGIPERNIFKTA